MLVNIVYFIAYRMEKVKKTLPYCSEAKLEQRYLTDSKEFIILHLTGEYLPTVRLILVWLSFLVYKDFLGGNKYVNDMAIALVVFSNIVYQICAKGVPKEMDAMASMTITYLVGQYVLPLCIL